MSKKRIHQHDVLTDEDERQKQDGQLVTLLEEDKWERHTLITERISL